jgi:SEC-C motif
MLTPARFEQEVFVELGALCTSPGYAHVIAYFCHRDNFVRFRDEMTSKDASNLFSAGRLLRTEISTLMGLMVKKDIDFTIPTPENFQANINRSEALLHEMHECMKSAWFKDFDPTKIGDPNFKPLSRGESLREPMFYGGEAAYAFQYVDFAMRKYRADNDWLRRRKGFSIEQAQAVVRAVGKQLDESLVTAMRAMRLLPPTEWTVLPGFAFSPADIAKRTGLEIKEVEVVLQAFTLPIEERNAQFTALNEFNLISSHPILLLPDGRYLLFQWYGLAEALYEVPFFWMVPDKTYASTAMRNRGEFAEGFSRERLELVFGSVNVYPNVTFARGKQNLLGEIDVLVLFGDRAIVLQAKSKRLTIDAKKGIDQNIQDDFKKSVQSSYDQALDGASALLDPAMQFTDANSQPLAIPAKLKAVYLLCIVADNYPALSFQARQFLNYKETDAIRPPLVFDVFTLDVMTEMLQSPLRFLSYISRRADYLENVVASQELTVLSYHLKQNLWLDGEFNQIMLHDDLSADLDIAMMARRDGVPGKKTPEGILTRYADSTLMRIVRQIESLEFSGTIELGFQLLMLGGDTIGELGKAIDRLSKAAARDGKHHDVTISLDQAKSGLTVHVNSDAMQLAQMRLETYCKKRKYERKAVSWYGICLRPDNTLRFGINFEYAWVPDAVMDYETRDLAKFSHKSLRARVQTWKAPGRNDPCHCGSGKKYKKCCLAKDDLNGR